MGKFKTSRMKENEAIAKAHRMAEAFASHRAKEFLKTFVTASSLHENIALTLTEMKEQNTAITKEEILEFLLEDPQVDLHFGMAVALAYAMGYSDRDRGASLKQLYVPIGLADKPSTEAIPVEADEAGGSQLILPGFEKGT